MDIEPVESEPEQAFPRAILRQRWEDLTFLHWAVAPELVAPLLPAGTRPDTLNGLSHVGLIGFRMVGLGFGCGPGRRTSAASGRPTSGSTRSTIPAGAPWCSAPSTRPGWSRC